MVSSVDVYAVSVLTMVLGNEVHRASNSSLIFVSCKGLIVTVSVYFVFVVLVILLMIEVEVEVERGVGVEVETGRKDQQRQLFIKYKRLRYPHPFWWRLPCIAIERIVWFSFKLEDAYWKVL